MDKPEFYVGRYTRKVDDRNRVTLPAQFCIPDGSVIYFSSSSHSAVCYDERRFAEVAARFSHSRFKDFQYGRVNDSGRLTLNGLFKSGTEVIIEGRGNNFFIRR